MNCRTTLPSWQALVADARSLESTHMKDLFAGDEQRFSQYSAQCGAILLDYSKNLINETVLEHLLQLAEETELAHWRDKMMAGAIVNPTEGRAVLHTALRDRRQTPIEVEGENIAPLISAELAQMKVFTERVREGKWLGYTGEAMTDVVSIGIGGSNLGPLMVTEALQDYCDQSLKMHYVSNVDGAQIAQVLAKLKPATTLFVISSKTFTTAETMTNAATARQWLMEQSNGQAAPEKHFVAISSNIEKAQAFGIDGNNIFSMWDWVGGRYSLWSAIGLPIALSLGFEHFEALLDGAHEMDRHFAEAPIRQNLPIMLALIGVWNSNFLGMNTQAILPYDQNLHRLPAYLQQADMESNGKSTNWAGDPVPYTTGPVIWGEVGINGQHAFYQLLHQGRTVVPADFIGSVNSNNPLPGHHENLMANFFAQSQAMMTGVDAASVRAQLKASGASDEDVERLVNHKVHEGNRPTNTLLMERLTPHNLGALVAMYEHKIFAQGIIWQICSFDQWGVELGKVLAKAIEPELTPDAETGHHDCSTRNLVEHFKAVQASAKNTLPEL